MSKAIADKADVGCLIAKVTPEELEEIHPYIQEYGSPTHVTDIYKLRSGTYKGARIQKIFQTMFFAELVYLCHHINLYLLHF